MPTTVPAQTRDRILVLVQAILERSGKTAAASQEARLVEIGLTSMDLVSLMLDIEAQFDVMIPPEELTAENFQSIGAIEHLVAKLSGEPQGVQAA